MDIHQDVRKEILTEAKLKQYIKTDRTILEQQDLTEGLTPLSAAAVAGYVNGVLLLLKSGAKADTLSRNGETPLLLAASKTEKNRARIIQLILAKIPASAIDATTPSANENTPLMFVVQKKDVESIRLLRKARASLTLTNDDGYTASDLAEKTDDRAVIRALNPGKEKADFGMLTDMVVSLLLFIVAWVNKVSDQAVRRMYGLDVDLEEAWADRVDPDEEDTTSKFVQKIDDVVRDSPLERFFKGKEDFIQEMAENIAELENDTSTSLGSPELLLKTIKVSLHQQVVYCDDSSSMKRDNRWQAQTDLVERISTITTRILPKREGVAVHFINQDSANSSNLRLDDIKDVFSSKKWDPNGDTEIGTYLEAKILKPLVYDKLEAKSLERPLLVSILTDGGPEPEGKEKLTNAILECSKRLEAAKYPRESVKFMIGQIGTSTRATSFLKSIRENTAVADMIYCTSDQLDDKFAKERNNSAQLDRWLIETLFEPLKDRKKKLES